MFTPSFPSFSSHPSRLGYTLPGFVSFGAFGLLSLDMRAGNGLLSLHNNAKCFLWPFGDRATHIVCPKISGQHAFEVLFSHINYSSLP